VNPSLGLGVGLKAQAVRTRAFSGWTAAYERFGWEPLKEWII